MTITRKKVSKSYKPFVVVGQKKEFRTLHELKKHHNIKKLKRSVEIVGKEVFYKYEI